MSTDPRQDYTILRLYIVGGRMLDDYTPEDAVRDYMRWHPDASEAEVRAELKRELEKLAA